LSAVIAPADDPPIAMRLGSTPYVAAFARKNRTAVCASWSACTIATMHVTVGPPAAHPWGWRR
jgi:hypothetical protein